MRLAIKPVAEYEAEPVGGSVSDGSISDLFTLNCYAGRSNTSAIILETQSEGGKVLDKVIIQVGFKDGKMKLIHLEKVTPKADQGGVK